MENIAGRCEEEIPSPAESRLVPGREMRFASSSHTISTRACARSTSALKDLPRSACILAPVIVELPRINGFGRVLPLPVRRRSYAGRGAIRMTVFPDRPIDEAIRVLRYSPHPLVLGRDACVYGEAFGDLRLTSLSFPGCFLRSVSYERSIISNISGKGIPGDDSPSRSRTVIL